MWQQREPVAEQSRVMGSTVARSLVTTWFLINPSWVTWGREYDAEWPETRHGSLTSVSPPWLMETLGGIHLALYELSLMISCHWCLFTSLHFCYPFFFFAYYRTTQWIYCTLLSGGVSFVNERQGSLVLSVSRLRTLGCLKGSLFSIYLEISLALLYCVEMDEIWFIMDFDYFICANVCIVCCHVVRCVLGCVRPVHGWLFMSSLFLCLFVFNGQ